MHVMTSYKSSLLWLFLSVIVSSCASHKERVPPVLEGDHSLIINVNNLACCEGVLRVAVYHDKGFWMSETGMVRGRIGMVLQEAQRIEIHGLPKGRYAVAVHQDTNGDGKLNRRFGFLPKEPYGFSNDVGKYGPASFSGAALDLDDDQEITVNMHHVFKKK